jgi:ABC-type branched-subunit amino acid transport system permease subunit
VISLSLFSQYTKQGRALRAVADDHQAALSVGISLRFIWVLVWSIAGFVALVAGIMWGAKSGVQFSLSLIALKALPVLILGGFTSIPGAIVGGLIIGVGEKLFDFFFIGGTEPHDRRREGLPPRTGSPTCWRWPSCCSGRRACSAKDHREGLRPMIYREAGDFKTSYAADSQTFPDRSTAGLLPGGGLPGGAVRHHRLLGERDRRAVPDLHDRGAGAEHPDRLLRAAQPRHRRPSWRWGPMPAFKLMTAFPTLNIVFVILLAGVVTAGVGVLFGLPSLRIKGFYLAVATLAAQFFLIWLFTRCRGSSTTRPPADQRADAHVFGYPVTGPAASAGRCICSAWCFLWRWPGWRAT